MPLGLAIGFALWRGEPLKAAVSSVPLGLELATACAWALAFLALRWLATTTARALPPGTMVFILALTAGLVVLYRTEPAAYRALYSAQYAVLVLLAFWLFDFLAAWLSPQTDPRQRRRAV